MNRSSLRLPQPSKKINNRQFLRSCIRSNQVAYAKLCSVQQGIRQPYRALKKVIDVLGQYDITLSPLLINRVMVCLANAWTNENVGLFDRSPETNLNIGLDLVLTQRGLPGANTLSQPSSMLRHRLGSLRHGRFVRALLWRLWKSNRPTVQRASE